MKRYEMCLAAAMLSVMMIGGAQANVVFSEFSHDADGAAYGTGTFPVNDLIVGAATGANYSGIAFFELPDRGGVEIRDAVLKLTVVSAGTMPNANADLYVLGYMSDPPLMNKSWLLITDTETRDGDTLGTGLGTDLPLKLVDNLVTAGTAMAVNAVTQTNTAQSIALGQYLNQLYDVYGAVAGDYVVIRVNPDFNEWQGDNANASKNFRYGGSHRGAQASLLTITLVPEPASMSMLAVGALALLRRRR